MAEVKLHGVESESIAMCASAWVASGSRRSGTSLPGEDAVGHGRRADTSGGRAPEVRDELSSSVSRS